MILCGFCGSFLYRPLPAQAKYCRWAVRFPGTAHGAGVSHVAPTQPGSHPLTHVHEPSSAGHPSRRTEGPEPGQSQLFGWQSKKYGCGRYSSPSKQSAS